MNPVPEQAPLSLEDIASLLEAGLHSVRAEVAALGPDGRAWRPAPDEWCVNEVVGHLIEAERRGFAGRIRHILERDNPELEAWDQPAVARARGDCARDGIELLAELERERGASLAFVRSLTPDQLARTGRHPDIGALTVRDLLHEWVYHDRDHLRQLLANVQLLMWPHMGAARKFY